MMKFRTVSAVFLLFLLALCVNRVQAQHGSAIPSPSYYACYTMMQRGDFSSAARLCREELGRGTKVGQQRWIDSICYYTMLGESQYIAGDPGSALESFDAALDIYANNIDWIARVTYPTDLETADAAVPPWGSGARNLPTGVFPRNAMIQIGDPITEERLKQGGMMKNPEMHKIDPEEILRCTALALRRRNEILGPLGPSDRQSRSLVEVFSKRTVTRNHWSSVLLDVLFGIALEGAGKHEEAVNMLGKSLTIGKGVNHFLAADALLTLGDIYLKSGKTFEAADSYLEASVSGYTYGNYGEVEEAVRKLAGAERLLETPANPFPLDAALSWASGQARSPWLTLSFTLLTAENLLRSGNLDGAESALKQTAPLLKSQGLGKSRYADRCRYLAAAVSMSRGKLEEGTELLAAVRENVMNGSNRFFQLRRLTSSLEEITPRTASDLYEELLRISDYFDWAVDPAASWTADTSCWEEELGNQFLLAIERDTKEKAFEVAQRLRVRRFLTSLDLGGRAFSLRYLIAVPDGNLTEEERVIRQNLLVDYPDLEKYSKDAAGLTEQLSPFSIETETAQRDAKEQILRDLASVSESEEKVITAVSSMPLAIPEIFPPRYDLKTLQETIPEKGAILSFIEIDRAYYGFLVTRDAFDVWRIGSSPSVERGVASFLTACGATDGSKAKLLKEFQTSSWRSEGNKLFVNLLGNPTADDPRGSAQFEKLTVVPDGVLWYVPFEALTLPKGDDLVPIVSVPNFTVACAPAEGLAFRRNAGTNDFRTETVIVRGKLHTKELSDLQESALAGIEKTISKPAFFPTNLRVSDTLLASRLGRLLVLQETPADGPFWVPFSSSERGKGAPITDWRFLPWGGPSLSVFPGFRSAAENSLKEGGNGSEFFVPLLIMESQGAETVLISRWRVGGRSAYRLTESFFENLEKADAAEAWKETVNLFTASPLDLKEEPRYKGTPPKETPNGEHPFFWAGYMLVHRSFNLTPEEEEEEETEGEEAGNAEGQADGAEPVQAEEAPGAKAEDSGEEEDEEPAETESEKDPPGTDEEPEDK